MRVIKETQGIPKNRGNQLILLIMVQTLRVYTMSYFEPGLMGFRDGLD